MILIPLLPETEWQKVKGAPGTRYAGRVGVAVGRDFKRRVARVMFPTSEKWRQPLVRYLPFDQLEALGPWRAK